jgi:nucleotide-binding universal stress UspA family protein
MIHERNEVVVGVDCSASAQAALRWAARYARFTFTDLRAVHVSPYTVDASMVWAAGYPGTAGLTHEWDSQRLRSYTDRLFDELAPDVDWGLEHLAGPPGPVLVRESQGAQLLILGTGAQTGLARILTGSVSHYCLSHALCPVVAIPPPPDEAGRVGGRQGSPRRWRARPADSQEPAAHPAE